MKTIDVPVVMTHSGNMNNRELNSLSQLNQPFGINHWRPLWAWMIRTPRQRTNWEFLEPVSWCREVIMGQTRKKKPLRENLNLNLNGFTGIVSPYTMSDSHILLEYNSYWGGWDGFDDTSGIIIRRYFPEFNWEVDENMIVWADTLRSAIHIIEDSVGLKRSEIYPAKIKNNNINYNESSEEMYRGIICDIKDETWWSNTGWLSFYMLLYRFAPFHKYFMRNFNDVKSLNAALNKSQHPLIPYSIETEYKINDRHYVRNMLLKVIRGLEVSKEEKFIDKIMEGRRSDMWSLDGIMSAIGILNQIAYGHRNLPSYFVTFTQNQAKYILNGE